VGFADQPERIDDHRLTSQFWDRFAELLREGNAWPGNVRQLESALEMAIALSGESRILEPADFPLETMTTQSTAAPAISVPDHGLDFEHTVSAFERSILMQALSRTSGNKKQAAGMLGLKRTTLPSRGDTGVGARLLRRIATGVQRRRFWITPR
jgi:DNA-binding NtrC family response regulator